MAIPYAESWLRGSITSAAEKALADGLTVEEIRTIIAKAAHELLLTPIPTIAVGDQVRYRGNSFNKGQTFKVVEVPGPSSKYGGAPAERYELERITATSRKITIFADRTDLEKV